MYQRMEMNLLAYPKNEEFDIVIARAYQLMMLLKNAELGIEPYYETVWKKKDIQLFDWSYDNFYRKIKGKIQKGDEDLGCLISFFSSLNDVDSAGIILKIGVSNKMFSNSLDISFPCTMNVDEPVSKKIEVLFKQCIEMFKPYYGAIINNKNIDRFGTSMRKGKPTTVHWMNYYASPELLRILDKAEDEYTFYKKESFQDGCYFRIKDLPINDDSEEDAKLQSYINHLLGLQ